MDLGLKGKSAIVTGGSGGIGKAVAHGLAAEGVKVAIAARRLPELQQAAKQIEAKTGSPVVPIQADCTKRDEIRKLVSETLAHFGKIDILVNSIGAAKAGPFLELSERDWSDSLSLKLFGQIYAAQEVFPHMQKQRWGRIINVIGTHAYFPEAHAMPAGVANAALMNFTKALAELSGPHGVLVNGVNPGTVRTARLEYLMDQGVTYDMSRITLGRVAEPEEIASVVVFLASERSSYICGASINVDGGQIKCL